MNKRHWRELVEIVGVVAIVASLLLLAAEVRQSNRLAAAEAKIRIDTALNVLNVERASNPDFAKLFPKLEAPEAHLTTATEASQIRGIAWHYVTVLRTVNSVYESGMLSDEARDGYIADLAYTIEQWPGIRPHFAHIYENLGSGRQAAVYSPIADYIASLEEQAE